MASSIAKTLADNLGNNKKDSYTEILDNSYSNLFAKKFGIKEDRDWEKFHQAFRVCTEGQGNELKSINNVVSSALLPLLTFFRLFGEKSGLSLDYEHDDFETGTIEFDQCFFEVRNKVIRFPSCVDLALYSSKQNVLLFIESKLSEYLRTTSYLEIKKGYSALYSMMDSKDILSEGDIIFDGSKIKFKEGGKAYFEGIKQSVSHLIGLVQGPSSSCKGVYYPEEYLRAYKNCYNSANTIYYATIILNPLMIGVQAGNDDFKKYVKLYSDIIGKHGGEIIECIRNWPKLKNDQRKNIKVLSKPLDYHDVFANNTHLLLDDVRRFYKFEE